MIHARNRKIKNTFGLIFARGVFSLTHLPLHANVTLIGIVMCFFALFSSWYNVIQWDSISFNAFHINMWGIGYLILLILIGCWFVLISGRHKEHLKSRTYIAFPDHAIIIFSGIFILLSTFIAFSIIVGFKRTFGGSIEIQSSLGGVVFEIMGACCIIFGGIRQYIHRKQALLQHIYMENMSQHDEYDSYKKLLGQNAESQEKNMKLPF